MAIVRPDQMDFKDKNFSMIISGSPGVGKTTLALSAPDPILIDFDKGVSRVKAQHRKTTIVCATYEEIKQDLQAPEVQNAKSIIIDTGGSFVTYLQDWAMRTNPSANRQRNGSISLKGFGAVRGEFVSFTNMLQYTMDKNIIYIFHTVEQKDGDTVKQRLLCEGGARDLVWQPCDLGCYMHMAGGKRVLGFTPTDEYFAKGCYGVSGVVPIPDVSEGIPNTFITQLFEKARDNISKETAFFEAEKEKYNAAIERGKEIVESITDVDAANAAMAEIKAIGHYLTSRIEVNAAFKQKIAELGLEYSKEENQYVAVSNDTIAS